VAPMVGALLAVELRQFFQSERKVLTHRLCGTVDSPYDEAPRRNENAC
jgi:hypothetical protein